MPSKAEDSTRSGIKKLATGEAIIPSSTRADGSVRKEIRVKPGYKPPEDVEVYKNRTAAAWKNRGKGGVPGAEGLESAEAVGGGLAANKNAKRREARKKAAANEEAEGNDNEHRIGDGKGEGEPQPEELDPGAEKAKEARKLAKKLRQAKELKSKKDGGDSLLPEQFDKVIRINELVRQLDALGFDAEGEKKAVDD